MKLTAYIVGSAVFYAAAMILMKFWGIGAGATRVIVGLLIASTFVAAAWCEIEALRVERLGMIYVAILGFECVFISVASVYWFGEQFSLKEIVGASLVIVGTAVAWG